MAAIFLLPACCCSVPSAGSVGHQQGLPHARPAVQGVCHAGRHPAGALRLGWAAWAGQLQSRAIWLPLHPRQAAAGNSPAAAHPRATLRCFHFLHCSCPQCVTADPLPACVCLLACLQLLSLAVRHRRVGSHELNMESSRSHSIFTGGARAGGGSWRLAALAALAAPTHLAALAALTPAVPASSMGCRHRAARHAIADADEPTCAPVRASGCAAVYVDCTPTRPDDHEFGITRYGKVGTARWYCMLGTARTALRCAALFCDALRCAAWRGTSTGTSCQR